MLLLIFIHCFFLVTPGLLPTSKEFLLANLFIKDDFPTFGIPSIIILIFLPVLPFSSLLSNSSFIISSACFITSFIPFPLLASVITARIFCVLKYSIHFIVSFSLAKSLLFNTIIFFLPCTSVFISGFLLDIGILLSNSSTTTSISFRSSCICLFVFAIWPGYQLMFKFITSLFYLFYNIR